MSAREIFISLDDRKLSLRRRWFELKRFFRHRSFVFGIFVILFMFAVFAVASLIDSPGEAYVDHMNHGRNMHKNFFVHGNRADVEDEKDVDIVDLKETVIDEGTEENTELPGAADPDTVFREGVLGNFEPDDIGASRTGNGERGEAVPIDHGLPEVKQAMHEYGFNTYVSDMISLNRSIPDVRMQECKYYSYPEDLPSVSVVIAFHNEGWSPLLRTVHSVLLRSPLYLLKEVLLVDDFSDKEHLGKKLEEYVRSLGDKVRLIRNKEREGLIRTRTIGAQQATGEVVLFLDAHCEVNVNWLPPLLAPIRRNRKVMTVPVIDGIDMWDWSYRRVYASADSHFMGIFEWGLLYKETAISEKEKATRKHNSMPFRSPTHAGGLFAIDKKWFETLGYYDPGLQIWGGEQYELSFKIWQCGGGILFVPCSHVGHVYRSHMPYGFGKLSGKPVISTNMVRVIKVWMDDYAKYYYIREPSAKHRSPGDISAQLALKERLKCKSFKWFLQNVAPDLTRSYPLLPENHVWGETRNPETGKCIDTMGLAIPSVVGASACHGYGGHQLIRLNKEGQLAQGEWCITPQRSQLIANHCAKGTVDGPFTYSETTGQIRLKGRDRCITVDGDRSSTGLSMQKCDDKNKLQKWKWKEIYTD
ncbi:hypothetical protein AB6A40_002304 [Gnathostoma spinigerum]|uniref:Polypeptide N-acetylgalactosaminyltransferase n=1 Tax=Gnathostoma spinigerum TaxID=75299 RepID=A0ABD6E7C4_9BILA